MELFRCVLELEWDGCCDQRRKIYVEVENENEMKSTFLILEG